MIVFRGYYLFKLKKNISFFVLSVTAKMTETESPSKSGLGKGRKYCKSCNEIIGARTVTCPKCKYIYPFKGKPRAKGETTKTRVLIVNPDGNNYNHENFPNTDSNINDNNPLKPDHSIFMKKKPNFIDIEPQQKAQMTTELIDSYINESQLLLDCGFEQLSNFGNLNSATKILNRSLINLTYLATLCDSNDHHQNKCPDLNDFI